MTYLCVDTWAGRREYPVEVVKETAKSYKIRLNGNEILPGRRVGRRGQEVYVPKYAIKHTASPRAQTAKLRETRS